MSPYGLSATYPNPRFGPNFGLTPFRRGQPETTLVDDEQGKFIFGPGGSFLIFLSNPETPEVAAGGRVAFGWWEEPITTGA